MHAAHAGSAAAHGLLNACRSAGRSGQPASGCTQPAAAAASDACTHLVLHSCSRLQQQYHKQFNGAPRRLARLGKGLQRGTAGATAAEAPVGSHPASMLSAPSRQASDTPHLGQTVIAGQHVQQQVVGAAQARVGPGQLLQALAHRAQLLAARSEGGGRVLSARPQRTDARLRKATGRAGRRPGQTGETPSCRILPARFTSSYGARPAAAAPRQARQRRAQQALAAPSRMRALSPHPPWRPPPAPCGGRHQHLGGGRAAAPTRKRMHRAKPSLRRLPGCRPGRCAGRASDRPSGRTSSRVRAASRLAGSAAQCHAAFTATFAKEGTSTNTEGKRAAAAEAHARAACQWREGGEPQGRNGVRWSGPSTRPHSAQAKGSCTLPTHPPALCR